MSREVTLTFVVEKNGDLFVEIPPRILAELGFPHSFRWAFEDGQITATPSRSRLSNRQIKKFKARHGL